MHRRDLLLGGLCLGALGIAASCGLVGDDGASSPVVLSPPPEPKAPPEAFIVRVGEAYRQSAPDEDDRGLLEAELPELAGLTAAAAVSALSSLAERVQDDFGAGRVVEVQGWILSETEGRAAALISLN